MGLRRIIKQFFEINYWYCFRKLPYLHYDDDKKKFVSTKSRAFHVSRETWEGARTILGESVLKIEYMFYVLKKHGVEVDWYMNMYSALKGTKNDKRLLAQKMINELDDIDLKKLPSNVDCNKEYKTIKIPFIIFHENDWKITAYITNYYDKKWKNIIDKKISFILLNDKERQQINTSQFSFKENTVDKLFELIRQLNVDVGFDFSKDEDVCNYIFNSNRYEIIHINPYVYHNLSNKSKQECVGNRKKLHDLLILRKMFLRLINISDLDDKYTKSWFGIPEAGTKEILDSQETYKKDVKELYMKLCNFMAENHDVWWD